MVDVHSIEQRSRNMAAIRGKDTKPELVVRKGLHRRGFRFRIHQSKLPGRPDLVFPKYRAVIFVNGCFWHRHECSLFKWPASRKDYWKEKLTKTHFRDKAVERKLVRDGWRVLNIWECALKGRRKIGAERVLEDAARWLVSSEVTCDIREMASPEPKSDRESLDLH